MSYMLLIHEPVGQRATRSEAEGRAAYAEMQAFGADLQARGLLVGAIRPPTVPAGSARLRVTLSAAHSDAQLELLLEALAECWPLLTENAGHA